VLYDSFRRSLKCWTRRDRRRELLRRLAERREQQNQTQTAVAAAIATSQSFVARLESTAADARVSTVERYAGSRGCVVQYHLVPLDQSADEPAVVVHESSSVSKGV
jgi:predicted transcriptional regulator